MTTTEDCGLKIPTSGNNGQKWDTLKAMLRL